MKKAILPFILIIVLIFSACGDAEISSDEESAVSYAESSEEIISSAEESPAESEISEEASTASEEASEEAKTPTLAKPEILGCTKLYDNAFVIIGKASEGESISYSYDGEVFSTKIDNGFFSLRIESKRNTDVEFFAYNTQGEISETTEYFARPKSVGSDKWKIIAGYDYQFHLDYCLDDFLHNNLYSTSKLNSLKSNLEKRQKSSSAEIIYIIIPSPATVYPETMPETYRNKQNGDVSRLDQVMEIFDKAGIKYINVKELFASHKNDEYKLYWKTDSHWTDYGAYLVYKELFDYISQKFPDAAPRTFEDFEWKTGYYNGGDMAYYLEYDEEIMQEYNVLRVPKFEVPGIISTIKRYKSEASLTYDQDAMTSARTIKTNRENLPSAVICRDSYSTQLYDILAERFDTTMFKAMWSFSYNKNDIQSIDADYLIYILTERNCDSVFS